MSLLLNMLSRLVTTFLPRSKPLLISWLQSPSAVILEPQKIKSATVSTVFPSISHEVMKPDAMIFVFCMLRFKPTFSLSSFIFIKRLFSPSSLYAIRVVSTAYLRLLIFLPAILIPACASSSPAFLMIYSVYKLNKHRENIQPWRTPFPIWNQSIVPCPVLIVAFWPAYRFLKRQVRWSGSPISWIIFHSFLWSTQRLWHIQKSRNRCFSGTLAFWMIQCVLAIWFLVLLPFLNPAWTSGGSRFTYCWSLAWRILSITLLACEMSAIVQ